MKGLLPLCALPLLALFPSCAVVIGNDLDASSSFQDVDRAVCAIHGTAGNESVHGTVTFTDRAGGVLIEAKVSGLTPGAHGFHIHQFGDVTGLDGKSAGGHFNPDDEPHAGPNDRHRHVGDLGNLVADAQGNATYSRFDDEVRLRGGHGVIGRAIVIHAGEDDLESQPTGAAGSRVGYGVIGVAKDN